MNYIKVFLKKKSRDLSVDREINAVAGTCD